MKIKTEAFRRAFEFVGRAVSKNTTIDILRCIRFDAADGRFTMAGNNLTMFADSWGECGEGAMSLCAKAERLGHALTTAGEEIDLKVDKGSLIWKSGKSRYTIGILPAADFPEPKREGPALEALEGAGIVEEIARVSFACATRDVRSYTLGVCVEALDGELTATATDGHRLASSVMRTGLTKSFSLIIPREVIANLPAPAGEIEIFDRRIEFRYANGRIVSQLIDATMPDWRRVFAVKGSEAMKVDRRALLAAIKASLPFDQVGSVHMVKTDAGLRVEGKDQGDEAEQLLEASGTDVDVWFLSSVIEPPLRAVTADEVSLEFAVDGGGKKTGMMFIKEGGLRYVGAPFSR